MTKISIVILPIMVLIIIIYGIKKKNNIYDSFVEGAKDGLITTFNIFPFIVAMIFSVNILLESGFISYILGFFDNFFKFIGFPIELAPMAVVRPISGTAALAMLNNILETYGPDSFIGRLASTMEGCADTTLYILTLYFGSVKITKSRHALKVGLFADFVSIVASIIIVSIVFK